MNSISDFLEEKSNKEELPELDIDYDFEVMKVLQYQEENPIEFEKDMQKLNEEVLKRREETKAINQLSLSVDEEITEDESYQLLTNNKVSRLIQEIEREINFNNRKSNYQLDFLIKRLYCHTKINIEDDEKRLRFFIKNLNADMKYLNNLNKNDIIDFKKINTTYLLILLSEYKITEFQEYNYQYKLLERVKLTLDKESKSVIVKILKEY